MLINRATQAPLQGFFWTRQDVRRLTVITNPIPRQPHIKAGSGAVKASIRALETHSMDDFLVGT